MGVIPADAVVEFKCTKKNIVLQYSYNYMQQSIPVLW